MTLKPIKSQLCLSQLMQMPKTKSASKHPENPMHQKPMRKPINLLLIGIAWCLAWGEEQQPQIGIEHLQQMRNVLLAQGDLPAEVKPFVEQAQKLAELPYPETVEQLQKLSEENPNLWNTKIGLVYGGATKIKQYVFEASNLQDIRGASALLDRINLIDIPAFFGQGESTLIKQWLEQPENFPGLHQALIPELIIYSTGGNILAFCPAAYIDQLANAIEKRYTEETLTANSCAVGDTFRFLELRFGLLKKPIEETNWLEWYQRNSSHPLVEAYYGQSDSDPSKNFKDRKSFNELVGQLATCFNQRRSGYEQPQENRPSRRYPPMFETHPYVRRDETEHRSAVRQAQRLPSKPWLSDSLARKRIAGQKSKRDSQNIGWYKSSEWLNWEPGEFNSWVSKFEGYLTSDSPNSPYRNCPEYQHLEDSHKEARSLRELGNISEPQGFVAYLYADGNNMGGYIQKIKTPQEYQKFSENVSRATEKSVYKALERHLKPRKLEGLNDSDNENRNGKWIHPFEILTIGGDDVMLIVPAEKALEIAKTIGEEFEKILLTLDPSLAVSPEKVQKPESTIHRCKLGEPPSFQCQLSMSIGVLITALDTPIYYAENLANQLLKSAKKKAKEAKKDLSYYGGTIDFLVMKSVTMLSSSIVKFREKGLVIEGKPKLKLYAAPYTLHEIGGLLETVKALKDSEFPRSQLYQVRSLLEQGKNTAILNYRYFRVRLKEEKQQPLLEKFEKAWCPPKDPNNGGNLAPWMSLKEDSSTTYETIWRELVDLYPFVEEPDKTSEQSIESEAEVS